MPTFERCRACVARGMASDETPIVPEGQICGGCEIEKRTRDLLASARDHKSSVPGLPGIDPPRQRRKPRRK